MFINILSPFGSLIKQKKIAASATMGDVVKIAAGNTHSLAIMADGSVMAWGNNYSGELGSGTNADSNIPVPVSGLDGTTLAKKATSIAAGDMHSLAIMADGSVKAWGYNFNGQLGNGTDADSNIPVAVSGLDGTAPATRAISVAAGGQYSLVVMTDGSVKSWGNNSCGQLGNATNVDSSIPVAVSGLDGTTLAKKATSIAAGDMHSLVIMADGSIKTWGYNLSGQLGNATTTDSNIPVAVSGIDGTTIAKQAAGISGGKRHSIAFMADGSVKAWGDNSWGKLGNGTVTDSNIPVAVSGLDGTSLAKKAISVGAGEDHSLANMANGSVKAWGYNGSGQLGNESNTGSTIPVAVSGLSQATQGVSIAAGNQHSIVVMADGVAKAWGDNSDGQLGNATTTNSNIPVSITIESPDITTIDPSITKNGVTIDFGTTLPTNIGTGFNFTVSSVDTSAHTAPSGKVPVALYNLTPSATLAGAYSATVTLNYPSGSTYKNGDTVMYWDTASEEWSNEGVAVTSHNSDSTPNTITFTTTHFTEFGILTDETSAVENTAENTADTEDTGSVDDTYDTDSTDFDTLAESLPETGTDLLNIGVNLLITIAIYALGLVYIKIRQRLSI